jgi:hypothetical protein
MKRIVTHLLIAAGLAAGACGVAQAHTNLSIGLSLGVPVRTYVAPAPVYATPRAAYYPGWDHRGGWNRDWNHGDRRWGHQERRGWDNDRGGRNGWRD